MSVQAVKERLAQLQANIAGVQRAFATGPATLAEMDLPVFVNFAGPAVHNYRDLGEEHDLETRTYFMRLYVAQVQQGVEPSTDEAGACDPFFEAVLAYFAARPSLGNLPGVQRARIVKDSGVVRLVYAREQYVGIEFSLDVSEYREIAYADYE